MAVQEYQEVIDKILNLGRGFARLDLKSVLLLLKLFNDPQKQFKSIHIAGTNGKGSVCHKIAKALSLSGYRTALYTSPHLFSCQERIKIDDAMISKEELVRCAKKIFSGVEGKKNKNVSFFEFLTLLALDYFAEQKVDFAVVEAGLGGRLDATNCLIPELAIITSISLEHTAILGGTLEEIAEQKGGIIKRGVPLILGPKAQVKNLEEMAKTLESEVIHVKGGFDFFDSENSQIALTALEELQKRFPKISNESIQEGVKSRPPCRFEKLFKPGDKLGASPTVILDVGHNPAAIVSLFKALNKINQKAQRPIRLVFGLSDDKDLAACTKEISKRAAAVHLVAANSGRSYSTQTLAKAFLSHNYCNFFLEESIYSGVKNALSLTIKGDEILLICGSFYIMHETMRAIKEESLVFREKIS